MRAAVFAIALTAGVLYGCGAVPAHPTSADERAERATLIALTMSGKPYRYGGSSPSGFDCSGLVYYVYRKVGREVPRTTEQQFRAVTKVDEDDLAAGDLVFFRLRGRGVSHVGLYTGDGRFVHAPSTGKTVEITSLDNPYWRERFVAAGRLQ